MTELIKVEALEAKKTYCAKRPGATWSLFGAVIINNANLKQIQYKHYDNTHTTNYSDLEGFTFKLRDGDLCYEEPATTTGGRNKKKSMKSNKKKSLKSNKKKSLKSLKANKNKKKSLKANKNKKKSSKH